MSQRRGDGPRRQRVRPGESTDVPFLEEMLCEAAFWRPDQARPPRDQVLADAHLRRYIDGWGRSGDAAMIALAADDAPVGAAWYRLFDPGQPGYGFVDAATPELSIGVLPHWRGRGVGSALLGALLERAASEGFVALSLSVERANPALSLYRRFGFVTVGANGGSWTLRAALTRARGSPIV